jgi:hypothetical protein
MLIAPFIKRHRFLFSVTLYREDISGLVSLFNQLDSDVPYVRIRPVWDDHSIILPEDYNGRLFIVNELQYGMFIAEF